MLVGAAFAFWSNQVNAVGMAPIRGWLDPLTPAARYDTRANYLTGWSHSGTIRPKFVAPADARYALRCNMSERIAIAGPGWRQSGILDAPGAAHGISPFYLQIVQRRVGGSTYSLTSDPDGTRPALSFGALDAPVSSGTPSEICLYHASAGASNGEGAYPLWYCGLSFRPATNVLTYVEFIEGGEPGIDARRVRQVSGSCAPVSQTPSAADTPAPDGASPIPTPRETAAPPTPTPEPTFSEESATEPSESTQPRPMRLSGDPGSICSSSIDGPAWQRRILRRPGEHLQQQPGWQARGLWRPRDDLHLQPQRSRRSLWGCRHHLHLQSGWYRCRMRREGHYVHLQPQGK
jgi:hypothetical protein